MSAVLFSLGDQGGGEARGKHQTGAWTFLPFPISLLSHVQSIPSNSGQICGVSALALPRRKSVGLHTRDRCRRPLLYSRIPGLRTHPFLKKQPSNPQFSDPSHPSSKCPPYQVWEGDPSSLGCLPSTPYSPCQPTQYLGPHLGRARSN